MSPGIHPRMISSRWRGVWLVKLERAMNYCGPILNGIFNSLIPEQRAGLLSYFVFNSISYLPSADLFLRVNRIGTSRAAGCSPACDARVFPTYSHISHISQVSFEVNSPSTKRTDHKICDVVQPCSLHFSLTIYRWIWRQSHLCFPSTEELILQIS